MCILPGMRRRLNISLPEETVRMLNRLAPKGERSWVIAEAVTRYAAAMGKERLRKRMRERAVKRAESDLRLVEEWLGSEGEPWSE